MSYLISILHTQLLPQLLMCLKISTLPVCMATIPTNILLLESVNNPPPSIMLCTQLHRLLVPLPFLNYLLAPQIQVQEKTILMSSTSFRLLGWFPLSLSPFAATVVNRNAIIITIPNPTTGV